MINNLDDVLKAIKSDVYLGKLSLTTERPDNTGAGTIFLDTVPLLAYSFAIRVNPEHHLISIEYTPEQGITPNLGTITRELIDEDLFFECVDTIWQNKEFFHTEKAAWGSTVYLRSERRVPELNIMLEESGRVEMATLYCDWISGRAGDYCTIPMIRQASPHGVVQMNINSADTSYENGRIRIPLPLPCDEQAFVDTLKQQLEPLDIMSCLRKLKPIVRKTLDEYLATIVQNI